MAFLSKCCPFCHATSLRRKRRTSVRYRVAFNKTGQPVGEYRYFLLQCYQCLKECALQKKKIYLAFDQYCGKSGTAQQQVVDRRYYHQADAHPPGKDYIGTTASQYTLRISAGADRYYF